MGRGLPSWQKYRAFGPVYEEIRLAEHAARLGSIVTHDRRGDVLFLDGFEGGLNKWVNVATGGGASVTLWNSTTRNGGAALKVLTSATNEEESGVERYTPLSVLSKMGCEFSLVFPAADAYAIIYLYLFSGAKVYTTKLRYRISTQKLSYWDSAGAWQDLSPIQAVYQGGVGFSTLKLVVDGVVGEYRRAVLNGITWDMTDIAAQEAANNTAPCVYISARVAAMDSVAVAVIIDDVILTQNEP